MIINVSAISFFNFSPVILGALVSEAQFTNFQISWLASLFMLGLAMVNISALFWQHKLSRDTAIKLGAAIATISFLVASTSRDFTTLAALVFCAGIGCGACFGLSIATLGEDPAPESKFGYMQALQTFTAASGIFFLPKAIAFNFGVAQIGFLISAFLLALSFFLAPSLKKPVSPAPHAQTMPAIRTSWVFRIAILILVLNVTAESAVWAFLERIADHKGIGLSQSANIIALSFFAAGAGSIAGGILGTRFGRLGPFLLAVGASLFSIFIFSTGQSIGAYFFGVMLFAGAWNFGACYRMGLAIAADTTGNHTTLIPAAQTIGAATGPALAGLVIWGNNFSGLYLMAGSIWIATVILFLFANGRLNKS